MFAKLLKHEFKATGKILGVLSLAALGVGLLGSIALRFIIHFAQQSEAAASNQGTVPVVVMILCGVFLMGCVLAIIAYSVASLLLLLGRFYTSKFTDEGYLTFTLPVTCHQILLSSLASMAIWSLIIGLVICADAAFVIFVGCSGAVDHFFSEFWNAIREVFHLFSSAMSVEDVTFAVLTLLNGLTSWLRELIVPMFAITAGALVAKKQKLLAAFGIYWVINMVLSAFSTVTTAITMIGTVQVETVSILLATGLPIVLNLAVCIAGYFLMEYMIRRKLNLP